MIDIKNKNLYILVYVGANSLSGRRRVRRNASYLCLCQFYLYLCLLFICSLLLITMAFCRKPSCTILHHLALYCTILHHFTLSYTILHNLAPFYLILHHLAQSCTIIFKCLSYVSSSIICFSLILFFFSIFFTFDVTIHSFLSN